MSRILKIGIDLGSTTAKIAVLSPENNLAFDLYVRHKGKIADALREGLIQAKERLGFFTGRTTVSGSAGIGFSERSGLPFLQETSAARLFIKNFYPEVKTLIDVGGEDSKIIFFDDERGDDVRMNGGCAGGTGAFIDRAASLLGASVERLDELASDYDTVYEIASRCGVFAKTDVQNLVGRKIPVEDIAKSIFTAVAVQVKNALLKGSPPKPKVAFAGGPLTFLGEMRQSAMEILGLEESDATAIDRPELAVATGAALSGAGETIDIDRLIFLAGDKGNRGIRKNTLPPLFGEDREASFRYPRQSNSSVDRISPTEVSGKPLFLGIDSGSTTLKIALIDSIGRLVFSYYISNSGDSVKAAREGVESLFDAFRGLDLNIVASCVTGYGEDLLKSALNLDFGVPETIAHFRAATKYVPDASFVLDIGGQDMKAIFIENGSIRNIEINEACSSGCGAFIESLSKSLDYEVEDFARLACLSKEPCDLGTRCTVFMNSKIKQSYREGADVADISAGLAYSVIKNCLYKVLRVSDPESLGEKIVAQGGTFKNPAVRRALEMTVGRDVEFLEIGEIAGAYGAALIASERTKEADFVSKKITLPDTLRTKRIMCKGCDNNCSVSKLTFPNGGVFYSGARCEKVFSNSGETVEKGFNFFEYEYDLIFNRKTGPEISKLRIGIPRVLNIFENFPFWNALLYECGFETVLSDKSDSRINAKGRGSSAADNVCFPAKLAHGHVENLLEKAVDRIFYPMATFEKSDFNSTNSFNCPIVTGYPDLLKNAFETKTSIPFDTLNVSFKEEKLLYRSCKKYLAALGVDTKTIRRAFKKASLAQEEFNLARKRKGEEIIEKNRESSKPLFVLAGRPYHADRLINLGIPEILADFGADSISVAAVPDRYDLGIDKINVLSQWEYANRILNAAIWAAENEGVRFAEINSFGCGPDATVVDEAKEILSAAGKNPTLLRVDEHASSGSIKLRIRSMIEAAKLGKPSTSKPKKRITTRPFLKSDRKRTLLTPFFSPFHSSFVTAPFRRLGYEVVSLPPADENSIENGLKYVNNEICFPATLIIGDIISALKSGKYDPKEIAVGLSQTGGQCRASNYVSLLKKAMVACGFEDVPVVSIKISKQILNDQPGFKFNKRDLTIMGALGLLFGDMLSQLYYSTAPREIVKGTARKTAGKYARMAAKGVERKDVDYLVYVLARAIEEFNEIDVKPGTPPKIGVIGEVYVKYNPAGNRFLVNEMVDRGVEVVMPPLINMFLQWIVNIREKGRLNLDDRPAMRAFAILLEKYFNSIAEKFDSALTKFRYYSPRHGIRKLAEKAFELIDPAHHYYGEGWLIAGDLAEFADAGVKNALCLQPFGCVANQAAARTAEIKMRTVRPDMRVLFLDLDAGACEANNLNRLQLLIDRASEEAESRPRATVESAAKPTYR